jgi:hypothetical protein
VSNATRSMNGEIVTWDANEVDVTYQEVKDALSAAGLDPDIARRVCPSNGLRRAVHKLSEGRIIREVDQDSKSLRMQFTAEARDAEEVRLNYSMEAVVTIDKKTGDISCDDPKLADKAREAVAREVERRGAKDVSAIVFRLFNDPERNELDLIPLRKAGGSYFVRYEGAEFLDKVGEFLDRLGCRLNRFPVANTGSNAAIRDAVVNKLQGLVDKFNREVDDFPEDASPETMDAAAGRIAKLREKIDSYNEFLDDRRAELAVASSEAVKRLRAKVAAMGQAASA